MTTGSNTMKVTNLVVPFAVTANGEFGRGGDIRITGDLTNNGSINALASGNHNVNALVSAENITNNAGASINSTVSLVDERRAGLNQLARELRQQHVTVVIRERAKQFRGARQVR